jgi:hypothetical protein
LPAEPFERLHDVGAEEREPQLLRRRVTRGRIGDYLRIDTFQSPRISSISVRFGGW